MSKPRKSSRSSGVPKAPTRRSPTPGRVPKGRTRGAPGGPRGAVGGRGGQPPRGASKRRTGVGGDQVEGRQAVRELLLAEQRKVREIWVVADAEPSPILEDIVELAESQRVPVRDVSKGKFFAESRCEAPQGVLAKAEPIREHALHDLVQKSGGQPPFLLALDGVTDPGNLGALLRSAECAGVGGVILPRHRSVHVTPTVTKTAAGAVEHLRFGVVGGLPTALADLRKEGVWVVGLDMDGPTSLWDLPAADGPICLVMGAEGSGLSRLVRQRCDEIVSIPLRGSLGSLNVAAAAALACFEVARARTHD